MTRRVLFIRSRNQWRSPTAEQVFSSWEAIEVASAASRMRESMIAQGQRTEPTAIAPHSYSTEVTPSFQNSEGLREESSVPPAVVPKRPWVMHSPAALLPVQEAEGLHL
jgi:protein-tyrosine-phosphatase